MNEGIDTTVRDAYEEKVIVKNKLTWEAFKIGYNSIYAPSVAKAIEIGKEQARIDKYNKENEDSEEL